MNENHLQSQVPSNAPEKTGQQTESTARKQRFFKEESALPTPRVEVRVQLNQQDKTVVDCDENLVMGLKTGDMRREQFQGGRMVDIACLTVNLGTASIDAEPGCRLVNVGDEGKGWIACHDGLLAHAIWDGQELGLPVYLVAEGRCQRIDDSDAVDTSGLEVFGLTSDTNDGISCKLFASRALAENSLRDDLGNYHTYGPGGPTPRFTEEAITAMVVQSREEEVQPKENDWFKIERMPIQGLNTRQADKVSRAPMVMAFQIFGLSDLAGTDDECEAKPIAELRVAGSDRRWMSVWEQILKQQTAGQPTVAIEAGTECVKVDDAMQITDLGVGIADAARAAKNQGFSNLLIRLAVVVDSAVAECERVRTVMAQDVFGDYNVPNDVPEWDWIAANASFASTSNGSDGVWEFVLNMHDLTDVPDRLARIIKDTQAAGISWLMIHQGT